MMRSRSAGMSGLRRRAGAGAASRMALKISDRKIGGALVAQVAIFLQRFVDDALQVCGHVGIETKGWGRRGIQNGFEDLGGAATAKRQCTRRHLVKYRAERE